MTLQDLTFQQLCALDYHRNMVVTSGPGAGKTRILTHRFCFILLTDETVTLPEILTLTFTEKAAEEMKGRIYEMLCQLDQDLHRRPKGNEKGIERIREARERFHRNRISTIHAFCADLLRDHPVESGIDPGFVIIQGAERRRIMEKAIQNGLSLVLKKRQDVLLSLLQAFGSRQRLVRAIRHVIEHPLNFKRVIKSSERLFRTEGWHKQVFKAYCRMIAEENLIPYLEGLRKLDKGEGHLKEVLALLEEWYGGMGGCAEDLGVPELFRSLRRMSKERRAKSPRLSIKKGLGEISYPDLVEEFFPDLFSPSTPDEVFEQQLRFFLEAAKVCIAQYRSEKERINALDFADLEASCHAFLTELLEGDDPHGLKRVQRRFKYIMVDEFQDTNRVQWEIISLLCSDKARNGKRVLQPGRLFVVGDKRQAIYKFRGGDVTVFEHGTELIRASNHGRSVQMFWQRPEMKSPIASIDQSYPQVCNRQDELFNALPQWDKEKVLMGDIYLPHNFRTNSRPIKFLNTVFDQIFSNKGAERLRTYETAPMPIILPDKGRSVLQEEGSVTLYLSRGRHSRKDQAKREATLVADIIEGLLGKHGKNRFEFERFGDIREKIEKNQLAIGILFFAFTHLKIFEDILGEAGLPFKVHRGKGFYRCEEVLEIVQLLRYLSDEGQHISLLAALRSPIFALTDSEIFELFHGQVPALEQFLSSANSCIKSVGEQIRSWRLLASRLTLAELLRTIIVDRGLTAIYSVHPNGMQRLANVEKLIEIARRFQADGNGALPEFVEYCLEMAEEEEEEGEAMLISEGDSPVSLMTIHSAKGLEFPMVIIPDLDRRPPLRTPAGKPLRLYTEPGVREDAWNFQEGEIPVWPVEVPALNYRKAYSPLGYLLRRRDKLEDMAENRRVFYVGCTRTRNHLVLIGHVQKRLMIEHKRALSTGDYRERATIMDLLDDIYAFNHNYPPNDGAVFKGNGGRPAVLWREPEPRQFRGVMYGGKKLGREDFGVYDEEARKLDLTEQVMPGPYYQFSFKSMRIFQTCPLMFYYHMILGLKWDRLQVIAPMAEEHGPSGASDENDADYSSSEALLVGNVIHRYLERHRFGGPIDEGLFSAVFERFIPDLHDEPWDMMRLAELKKKAFKQLETAVHDSRLVSLLQAKIQHAEVPFLFTISGGCEFRGTIDRLFREKGTGQWAILDWKSNELGGKDPHLVMEENYYGLQLACYKWAVEHILKERVGELYIYFTDGGKLIKSHWEGHPREVIEAMLQKIQEYEDNRDRWVQDMREMKEAKQDCLYCGYKGNLCPRAAGSL